MGSFNFRWEHPAQDVHVTGTFDNWSKSVQLDKVDTGFEKLVSLPPTTEKVLYKFVVDGTWIHDHTGKTETDHEGNVNNVLYPEDVGPPLPMANNITGTSAAPTTTQLAGQQPLEQRGVPTVVTDSQQAAHVDPEASASPRAVEEKNQVENELKSKVPEEKPVSETNKSTSNGGIAAAVTGGVAAAGAAAAGAAVALNQKTKETTGKDPVSALPQSVQNSINEANSKSSSAPNTVSSSTAAPASAVPEEVKESQKEAHVSPEASANPEAVQEKSQVEKELLSKVHTSQETGEHAPAVGGAGAAATTTSAVPVRAVPEEVKESQKAAHAAPEASANAEAVEEKSAVEKELLAKVHTSEASGEPAPVVAAAAATTAPAATSASGAPQLAPINLGENKGLNAPAAAPATTGFTDSRDVSPMSKTATTSRTGAASQPMVTDGVNSTAAPATSGTPVGTPRKAAAPAAGGSTTSSPSTPAKRSSMMDRINQKSSGTPDSGKEKKKGFFSKIKEKLQK